MTGSRRGLLLLTTLLVGVALVIPAPGAYAGCVGPQLRLEGASDARPTVRAGAAATADGDFFVDGCDDTGGNGSGLGCSAETREVVRPLKDVPLILIQGERRWRLGVADAGTVGEPARGRITWSVQLPEDVRRGPAMLVAGDGRLPIRVGTPVTQPGG